MIFEVDGKTWEVYPGVCSSCGCELVQEVGIRTYHPWNAFLNREEKCEAMDIYGVVPDTFFIRDKEENA